MQSHTDDIRCQVRNKHSNYFRPGYVKWHFNLVTKATCFGSIIAKACSVTARSWQANSSAYQNRWSKAGHVQLKNYCINLSLSSRNSLKISQKIMSPIFILFEKSVTIRLPGKWAILHDIGTASERKSYAVLYTSNQEWFLFVAWCKVKTVKWFWSH